MKTHIDTYLVGQVMGNHLAEYCQKKDIDPSDMNKKITENEGVFILGLLDGLGWGSSKTSD